MGSQYSGDRGREYFAHQQPMGELSARLNRSKFERHLDSADTVIDFGCGAGGLLAGLNVARRIGVEPNPLAREIAAERGLQVYASATELEDGVADVVISNHALEHTDAPLAELRELYRALRPGGRFVLWLPLDDWRSQRHPTAEPDHHLYTWTPLLLGNLLEEAGFEVENVNVVAYAWPPRTESFMRLPRPLFDVVGRVWSVIRRRRQLAALGRRVA